jgi:hypothetical protein
MSRSENNEERETEHYYKEEAMRMLRKITV